MKFSTSFFLSFAFSLTEAVSLNDALTQAGATQFAALIQANPAVAAVYSSGSVQTVFAPIDGSAPASGVVTKRQNANQDLLYQSFDQTNTIALLSVGSGKALASNSNSGNLGPNANQSVVTNPLNTTTNNAARRWTSPLRRDGTTNTTSSLPSLLKIFSGLGNNVSIIKADIPYDGGLIQLTDGYFTFPQPLSLTASANGHTAFLNLSASSNLTATLDNTPAITVFIPSNAAFSSPNATSQYSSSSSLLSGHVLPNFVGYLPSLQNGASYVTQDGTNITITVRGSDYYVNNAKIVASNQILENGVAHVIDSIITPSKPTQVVVSAAPLIDATPRFGFAMVAVTVLLLLTSLY